MRPESTRPENEQQIEWLWTERSLIQIRRLEAGSSVPCRLLFFSAAHGRHQSFFQPLHASDIVGSIYFTLPQATMPQPAWIQGRLGTEGPLGRFFYNTVLKRSSTYMTGVMVTATVVGALPLLAHIEPLLAHHSLAPPPHRSLAFSASLRHWVRLRRDRCLEILQQGQAVEGHQEQLQGGVNWDPWRLRYEFVGVNYVFVTAGPRQDAEGDRGWLSRERACRCPAHAIA